MMRVKNIQLQIGHFANQFFNTKTYQHNLHKIMQLKTWQDFCSSPSGLIQEGTVMDRAETIEAEPRGWTER